MKKSTSIAALVVAMLALAAGSAGAAVNQQVPPFLLHPAFTHQVQILGLNDFHGNLEPPTGSGGRIGTTDAGGVEFLATHVRELRAANDHTLFVSAGDLIGATPL